MTATQPPTSDLADKVRALLGVSNQQAADLVVKSERLYKDRMRKRFSNVKLSERLRRTNPFLLRIRGARTVRQWAELQVRSVLFASEEEAVGHLLEEIARTCFPGAVRPAFPADFDFEVVGPGNEVHGYQVKGSWDCMPMSTRKNLSNTILKVRAAHRHAGKDFVGYFAPFHRRATSSKPPGQEYEIVASKEFWRRVGGGREDFDVRVGDVCALLCSEFRHEVEHTLVPGLVDELERAALSAIGNADGTLDYAKLFRRINP